MGVQPIRKGQVKLLIQGLETYIRELKITEAINRHAEAKVTFEIMDNDWTEIISKINSQSIIHIESSEDGVMFSGIPVKVRLQCNAGVYFAELELKSHTFKLDIVEKSKSFQDRNNPYSNIFDDIMSENNGAAYDTASNGATQEKLILQYRETDWNFLLRVASMLEAITIVNVLGDIPRVWIGVLTGNRYTEEIPEHIISKDNVSFLRTKYNYRDSMDESFTQYTIESCQRYMLGDKVIYNSIEFVVIAKETQFRKGVIIYSYTIRKESGCKTNLITNHRLCGLSLEGTVLNVASDKVKLHLAIDEEQDEATAEWSTLSSAYTAEGSTGFYSMPQVGDSAQLYFRTDMEWESYAKIISRKDGKENAGTQNPKTKYYENNYGKEMMLSPDSLNLTAKDDEVLMNMNETSGVDLTGNPNISVNSPKITFSGNKINITAKDTVTFVTKGSNIITDEIVHIWGDGGVSS